MYNEKAANYLIKSQYLKYDKKELKLMALFECGLPTKSIRYFVLQLFPIFAFCRNVCQK